MYVAEVGVIGIAALIAWFIIWAGINRVFRETYGHNMPTRSAMRGLRRRARKRGISEAQAYDEWARRKIKQNARTNGRTPNASQRQSNRPRAGAVGEVIACRPARSPQHRFMSYEELTLIANVHGLTLRKQAFGLYFILGPDDRVIQNPYAAEENVNTDFTHRDAEDYLLNR